MSYYIKNANGGVYSDTVAGGKTIKQVIQVRENGLAFNESDVAGAKPGTATSQYNHPHYMYGDSSYSIAPEYNSRYYVPYVAIKDASSPMYWSVSFSDVNSIDDIDFTKALPDYHRLIAICSYKSKRNNYEIGLSPDSQNPTMYIPVKNVDVIQKELYPIIKHCDREKGNTLYYHLSQNGKCFNARWYNSDGPYYTAVTAVASTDVTLRPNSDMSNPNISAGAGELSANLKINDKTLYYFKQDMKTDENNTMFGFKQFAVNSLTSNPGCWLKHFRLNVSDIKTKGNQLKLQYFWNCIYDYPDQLNNFISEYLPNGEFNKPFVFNYHLSDDEEWQFKTQGYPWVPGDNLQSSLDSDGINHCESVNTQVEIKKFIPTGTDTWGELSTYNNLWINYVNTANYDERTFLKINFGEVNRYILSSSLLTYQAGSINGGNAWRDIVANKRYICDISSKDQNDHTVYTYYLGKAKENIANGTPMSQSQWDLTAVNDISLATLVNNNSYETYQNHFEVNKYLSAQNGWSNYSANFLPYVRASNNTNIFDLNVKNQEFSQMTTNDSRKLVYKVWKPCKYPYIIQDTEHLEVRPRSETTLPYLKLGDVNNSYIFNYNCYNSGCKDNDTSTDYKVGDVIRGKREYGGDIVYSRLTADLPSKDPNKDYFYWSAYSAYTQELTNITNEDEYLAWLSDTANGIISINPNSLIFVSTKTYNYNDYVAVGDYSTFYSAACDIKAGSTLDTVCWHEDLFDLEALDLPDSYFVSRNFYGSASYTIDLSDTNKTYLHIAYPSTVLINPYVPYIGPAQYANPPQCNLFVTDFKMTYEAID